MSVEPVPEGYPRVSPYLYVHDAAAAVDFYRDVLGAVERVRMPGPGGRIGHAELTIGESVLMLADEFPDMDALGPRTVGGSPVTIFVYVEDVDDVHARALAAGARELSPVKDQFYGDRSGGFEDPFGHRWNVATHVEDVGPEEMKRRMDEAMAAGSDTAAG
ncbi:VOC family protein [Kitasatospora sp. NBC_00315]|uniref:VOC family protein n=1 Tax=Kitasatospora sp. NBC_00315 TaxID=2975963 RepID=UPI00324791CE